MESGLELEMKWSCPEGFDVPALIRRLELVAQVVEASHAKQRDTYYDTASRELAEAGLSARVRKKGERVRVELKVVPIDAALVLERTELRRDLDSADELEAALKAFIHEVTPLRLKGPLQARAVVRNDRKVWRVVTGRCVAELCADDVKVSPPGKRSGPGFRELELELVDGDREAFFAISQAISEDAELTANSTSKYLRALELLGEPTYSYGAPSAEFSLTDSLDDVARAICREQLATLKSYEPGTRVGLDSEHLHKMRVAIRRLRSALSDTKEAFAARTLESLMLNFKWLAAVLGDVRDLDVHMLDVPLWKRQYGAAPAEGWARLEAVLDERWQEARERLLKVLASRRARQLLARAERAFAAPPKRSRNHPAQTAFGRHAAARLEKRAKQFRKAVQAVRANPVPEAIHELRKVGKKLRYTAEFTKPLLGKSFNDTIKAAKAFQENLGRFQDSVVAGELAASLRDRALAAGDEPAAYSYVLGALVGGSTVGAELGQLQVERALEAVGGRALTRDFDEAAARLRRKTEKAEAKALEASQIATEASAEEESPTPRRRRKRPQPRGHRKTRRRPRSAPRPPQSDDETQAP